MFAWVSGRLFVWSVRAVVLLAACFSMRHILADQLGYRVEVPQLLFGGLLMIVTVRVWMPWASTNKKSFDDVSEP
jgi:hypothetical protein